MKQKFLAVLVFLAALPVCLAAAQEPAQGPRPGKYRIMSYGATSSPPLFLGYFILGPGTYKAFLPGDKASGEGRYSYDSSTRNITWNSGPYAGVWGGEFTIDRDGQTHKVRLKRTTIATNNKDSP